MRPDRDGEDKPMLKVAVRISMLLLAVLLVFSAGDTAYAQEEATNLGQVVNGMESDFGPIVTADGDALYYTSDRAGGLGGQDCWMSKRVDGQWGKPVNLGRPVNTEFNEGPDTLSVDEKIMFFTRCDKVKEPGTCDLYMATWDESKNIFSNVQNLGNKINSKFNDANASLSYDASTLYFVSDRPSDDKKRKNWDIFVSHKEGNEWGTAKRVGAPVNTTGNEIHVMIHQNDTNMYFSSDGHGGFGGADILMTTIENGIFEAPKNLGPLINTPDNDMYFTIPAAGDLAYLTSNRSGTHGQEDIYSVPVLFDIGKGVIIVKGIVANKNTCAPPTSDPVSGAAVYDIKTCTPIGGAVVSMHEVLTDTLIKESVTGPTGFYQVVIPAGSDYAVSASATNFSFYQDRFNVSLSQFYEVIERNILLVPEEVGMVFTVNNVYFDFDKATLRPESKNALMNAVRWLQGNNKVIEVGGHTDSKGSDNYNLKLSQRRATSVYDFLIANGINPARLQAHGYGERMPIASNSTDEGRQINRRVEFKIIK